MILSELKPGQRFMLCRTGEKYVYLGKQVSQYGGWFVLAAQREFGDRRVISLHSSCHVKPVIRAS